MRALPAPWSWREEQGEAPLKEPEKLLRVLCRVPLLRRIQLNMRRKKVPEKAEWICREIETLGAESAWVTLSSPEVILVAAEMCRRVPLRVTVWDAPEYLLEVEGIRGLRRQEVLAAFERVLAESKAISVVSGFMRNSYAERHEAPIWIIRHGVSAVGGFQPGHVERGVVRLVFAGSMYARAEWNSFVQALEDAAWTVSGKRVELLFIGRIPRRGVRTGRGVRFVGELPFNECVKLVASCDAAYLPYWLSPEFRLAATYAFPGKFSKYLACGVPIFHHGPRYAEVSTLIDQYGIGVNCSSYSSEEIISSVGKLVDILGRPGVSAALRTAFEKEFSKEEMISRFHRFMGSE